jgi:hypothetical protein
VNGVFTLHSSSREAGEANQIADPKWTYELARSGIWAEVESQRQPIVINDLGVANKAEPYTDTDVRQLTQIMDVVWKITDRQQADGELRRFAEQLETRVEERTREFEDRRHRPYWGR